MIKIGINGLGRIGRLMMRIAIERDDVEVVAANDLLDIEQFAYLINYDGVHSRFNGSIVVDCSYLVINNKRMFISKENNPNNIPWGTNGVDVVPECTGIIKNTEQNQDYI